MFQWGVLITTVLGSLILRRLFNHRQRLWIMPLCLAYTFALSATIGSVGGFLHFAFTAWNFVIVMFLCNGFYRPDTRNNPTWKAFMVFWLYMFFIVFTGYFPLQGACTYLQEFVKTFAAGYFLVLWIGRTEGALKNTLVAVLVAAWLSIVYSVLHGGLDANALDSAGRAGLNADLLDEDVSSNVNHVALSASCFLPFLLVLIFKGFAGASAKMFRLLAVLAFVFLSLILIRTGSRNGALAFVPCVWYFFKMTKKRGQQANRVIVGLGVLLLIVVGVGITMRKADSLRAFDFFGKGQESYGNTADQISSGRMSMYERLWDRMSPMERIFGKGLTLTDSVWNFNEKTGEYTRVTKFSTGNVHSIYMAIFCRSGFVGVFLFLVFLWTAWEQGRRLGDRGRMAFLFIGVWLATGVGEAWGMIGGNTGVLAGIGMGLLTRQRLWNTELAGPLMPSSVYPVDPRGGFCENRVCR